MHSWNIQVNMQNWISFLYRNNDQKELKIPFTSVPPKIKYLGININLTKHV